MLTLLSEVHFWSTNDDILIKPNDYGSFKYHIKKDSNDSLYQKSKRSYCEQRGQAWNPTNKRPHKLKEKLKELEIYLLYNKTIAFSWEHNKLQLLLSKGILITIIVNANSDFTSINFDKHLTTKIQTELICDGVINGSHVACICTDGRVLGYGGTWREGWVIESGPRRHLSLQGEILTVWGRASVEHPQPWSPLAKDHQRANLHMYWIGARGPELLAYKKTDSEPITIIVSKIFIKSLIIIEQKVSQRGAVSVEVIALELIGTLLKRTSVTSVPLQTQVSCCALSPNEIHLILGCIDGSVALLDRNRGSTRVSKASFIPTLAVWHVAGTLAALSNEKGQLQYFDVALNSVKSQLNGEDCTPIGLFDLSGYFNSQKTVASIHWGPKDLLVILEQGPLLVLTHMERSLNFLSVSQCYVSTGKVDKAINLLLCWEFNDQCFSLLQRIVAYLMKQPLTEDNAQHLQNALGSFHNSPVPLTTDVRHRFGSQVRALTRRFFHQLVRYKMFETAFLLAVDISHHDLFMDLYYIAVKLGEREMAAAARAQASALLSNCSSTASECSRSSCSQCSGSASSDFEIEEKPFVVHNDNTLTTKFNSPKMARPVYVPPVPNLDLPKVTLPKPTSSTKPIFQPALYRSTNVINSLNIPPLPITSPQLSPAHLNHSVPPIRTYSMPTLNIPSRSVRPKPTVQSVRPVVPPPLPVAPLLHNPPLAASFPTPQSSANKKPQAKVKFSDTVTAFIVPEVKRPVRPPPPPYITDPQKELADSLPLCHPNEDYLKDFTPARRGENDETPAQSKIKVVHFGVV